MPERSAWCKPCEKATKYILVGTGLQYMACEECGAIYHAVTSEHFAVFDELRAIHNSRKP